MLQVSITETLQAFEAWRITRKNKREKIPDALWQMVGGLLKTHRPSKICKTLGLSGRQLHQRFGSSQSTDFVEAIAMHAQTGAPIAPIHCNIQGKTNRIELTLPCDQVSMILPQLAQLL